MVVSWLYLNAGSHAGETRKEKIPTFSQNLIKINTENRIGNCYRERIDCLPLELDRWDWFKRE